MHEYIPLIVIVGVLLFLAYTSYSMKNIRLPDGSLKERLEEIRRQADSRIAEQTQFQDQLLAELRRHNAAMEQQNEIISHILERLGHGSGLS